MKKLMFFAAFLGLVFLQSCEKFNFAQPKATVTQTENATLKVNESYTFTLPTDIDDDSFFIATAPTNASISRLTSTTYLYTPNAGFIGSDVIVLSNEHEKEMGGGCGHHGGPDSLHPPHDSTKRPHLPFFKRHPRKGKGHGEVTEHNHYLITINLNIAEGDTAVIGKTVKK